MEFGIVVIGRNEGKRLESCLDSVVDYKVPTIYVDSASEDDSLAIAEKYPIGRIEIPYFKGICAAYARNQGAKKLLEVYPQIEFIQFVDGDTTLSKGWLQKASETFAEKPDVALVTGELLEKDHDSSIYKWVSMIEWQRAAGEISACGGNFAIRAKVFQELGGFNPKIIAGEDTEFCLRVRQAGWILYHAHAVMGTHDTKIGTFGEFWTRCVRTGYSFQQISGLYFNNAKEKLFLRDNISNWVYGGVVPALVILLLLFGYWWGLLLLLIYPLLFLRIYFIARKSWPMESSVRYALLCTLSKLPGFVGAAKYLLKG